MEISIKKTYQETAAHIDNISNTADKNRASLSFLPKTSYEDAAIKGNLWAAVNKEDRYVGHLYFGGRFPTASIVQLLVAKEYRKKGIAKKLFNEFTDYLSRRGYLTIKIRVASDLKANKVWESFGFKLADQVKGGKTTGRKINIYVFDLKTPSLFPYQEEDYILSNKSKAIKYTERPVNSDNYYLLDLNIIHALRKKEADSKDIVQYILSQALRGNISIYVTSEMAKELKKTSSDTTNDALLELVKSLPTLPELADKETDNIAKELYPFIFPGKESYEKLNKNELSDLKHIAIAIYYRCIGFITLDRALLRSANYISESYELKILSPYDFYNYDSIIHSDSEEITQYQEHEIYIKPAVNESIVNIERFLLKTSIPKNHWPISSLLQNNNGEITSYVAKADDEIICFACWTQPFPNKPDCDLYISADESNNYVINIVDRMLELAQHSCSSNLLVRLHANFPLKSEIISNQLLKRGFMRTEQSFNSMTNSLSKLSLNGIVTTEGWNSFRQDYCDLTGLQLPEIVPAYSEALNTGLILRSTISNESYKISLFDFETSISPGYLLLTGREGLILPIKPHYANQIFPELGKIDDFFPSLEAKHRFEKAYFRSTKSSSLFEPGKIIFFFVSGNSINSGLAGRARITYSEILTPEESSIKLSRQGVLDKQNLNKTADKHGKLHAFTFDNFVKSFSELDFKDLRNKNIINKANLVTVQTLDYKAFIKLSLMSHVKPIY